MRIRNYAMGEWVEGSGDGHALYHAVTADRRQADAVVRAIADQSDLIGRALPVLGLGGEIATAAASAGLPFVREAFLDRGYAPDGGLVARTSPGKSTAPTSAAAQGIWWND